ncbi:MAG: restriction endonuclease subunit S [Prevotellaceae bacterium]|nr:restriction endonuclease subunit S [Prevotellaceae bacterium]
MRHSKYSICQIAEIAEVIAGQSPESEHYNEKEKGLPFYQGKSDFGEIYLQDPVKWTTKITKEAIKNDILISVRAPVGPVNISPFQIICIGRGLAAIRTSKDANYKYLFYILKHSQERTKQYATGSTFEAINKKDIENILIPLPPLDIQLQIVDELDGYQQIINGAKMIIENYKPFIKLDSEWEMVKVEDVVDFLSGVTLSVKECENNNGLPIITIADITEDGYINYGNIRKIKTNKNAIRLKQGDLLFNWRNGSKHLVGKTALFERNDEFIFASFLLGLRPKNKIDSYFLWAILNQYRIKGLYFNNMRQQVNGLFNREELKDVKIPLPPIEIQKEIVAKIKEEEMLVAANKKIVEIFEKKITDRINQIWGC